MKKLTNILTMVFILISCSNDNQVDDKDFFVFEPDIRLFTTYAFMNAAGFDHDYNENMHPIRVEIRAHLDSILDDEYKMKIKDFYQKHGGGDFYGYGAFALNTNSPPDFTVLCDTCEYEYLKKFNGYDSILKEFFKKAEIENLWGFYKDKLEDINLQYKPYAETALKQITSYCRVDSNYYKNIAGQFHYQQIPLMSYFTAYFNESGDDYWVVSGPSLGKPDPSAFYHESLHRIVNPIVESNSKINEKILALVPLSQEKLKGSYNNVAGILCESFVRTIDKVLATDYHDYSDEKLKKKIEDEYKLGHILTFYLYENLPIYESNDKSLKEYYPELIANIDIEVEKQRWNEYWNQEKK